ncbi:unnamed protein product [Fraxinus pennsylvanica]|uniref:RRM domain-containing protein n=1 Tax=Fraxinus pennsylvanica TaxID=56036 RepID=A0AAD2DSG8_9LAMI|nr:unnamed protein product [Fraxinus pennsylvanica]
MATTSSSSSLLFTSFLQKSTNSSKTHPSELNFRSLKQKILPLKFTHKLPVTVNPRRLNAVAEDTSVSTADPSIDSARRLYVGNIPRTVTNDELRKIVEDHGAVEKAEVMYDKYSGRSRRCLKGRRFGSIKHRIIRRDSVYATRTWKLFL